MTDEEPLMIHNPYKAALERAKQSSVAPANALEDALRAARTAMNSGAWTGPKGEDFSGELDTYRSKLTAAGPAAIAKFDSKIGDEEEMVPATSWQAHWQKLMM